MPADKVYLGDGVYVQNDPQWPAQLILTAENGIEATDTIYLEPDVQRALYRLLQQGFVEDRTHGKAE